MDALPFCRATLLGMRCPKGPYFIKAKGYPTQPTTMGEAIRKRRLDLGLRQTDVANSIGCDEMTIVNWEKGHTRPRRTKYSSIRTFLGPLPKEWLVWFGA
jgi:DNA-binding XRE family transcriptional regulator